MITVRVYRNPLSQVSDTHSYSPGTTLRAITADLTLQNEWPTPTIAQVNGEILLRATWDDPLPEGADVVFRAVLAGGGSSTSYIIGGAMIVAGAAMTIASFGTLGAPGIGLMVGGAATIASTYYASLQKPNVPASYNNESGSPTYSLGYRGNLKRVGEPIPVLYGTHRLMPDQIASSYSYYAGNDQYVVAILCLGCGEFSVNTDTLRFGEALFSELADVQYQIIPPGEPVTLCSDHVATSESVSGQAITGPGTPTHAYGSPTLTVTSLGPGGGYDYIKVVASSSIFGSVPSRGTVTISGFAGPFNGPWEVIQTGGSLISARRPAPPWIDNIGLTESPQAGLISYAGTALIVLPTALQFAVVGGVNHITGDPGTFTGRSAGDTITVGNTTSNNRSYVVQSVASDGSYMVVTGDGFTAETAINPQIAATGAGWISWFEAGGAADSVSAIECDFIFAAGLGTLNTSSGVDARSVTIEMQYQGVDSSGAAVGTVATKTLTVTEATHKAVRQSFRWTNDTGHARVRVRVRRTTDEDLATTALNACAWSGLKGYLPQGGARAGVTVLAVVAKATEQLSGTNASQINVVATRKLPIWNGTTWSAPTATSSMAWALADVLRNTDYGAAVADNEIDLAALLALDAEWSARGDSFNGVFDQTGTIWEALQKIARCGRAQPVLSGGVVTFVRDRAQTVRAALFLPDRILPDSLRLEYRLPQDGDPDGTSVAWIDPANSWQAAHAEYPSGSSAVRPQSVDLFGCTNADQALREATYMERCRLKQRKAVTFSTEMDGHLVGVGDLVGASHDVIGLYSAQVVAVTPATITLNGDGSITGHGTILTLDDETIPTGHYYILLRKPNGSVDGPYSILVTAPSEPENATRTITLPVALDWAPRTDLSDGDRTLVSLGTAGPCLDLVVSSVTPGADGTVEIAGIAYDASVHAAGA